MLQNRGDRVGRRIYNRKRLLYVAAVVLGGFAFSHDGAPDIDRNRSFGRSDEN
jgi:hypothetical protein